jgi:hypothetical protein
MDLCENSSTSLGLMPSYEEILISLCSGLVDFVNKNILSIGFDARMQMRKFRSNEEKLSEYNFFFLILFRCFRFS